MRVKAGSSIASRSPVGVSTSTIKSSGSALTGFRPGAKLSASARLMGPRRFVGLPKPGAIPQQFVLFPCRQVRKSFRTRRTPEREEAVAINSGETCEGFCQLLTAHALDRIAPEALHCSDNFHVRVPFSRWVGSVALIAHDNVAVGALDNRFYFRLLRGRNFELVERLLDVIHESIPLFGRDI